MLGVKLHVRQPRSSKVRTELMRTALMAVVFGFVFFCVAAGPRFFQTRQSPLTALRSLGGMAGVYEVWSNG